MTDFVIGTSILASFIAGIAALLAPCCITVLLPTYFASIFHEKRKIFLMTFIFFLGIFTVFLPLGLGSAAFGQLVKNYHNIIFTLGGFFLFILGINILLGNRFSLHLKVNPAVKNYNFFSIFLLGILSGIATTCCAPVLAGVLALAILPGSIFWGLIYTLSYVLGMVLPLFIISLFLDKTNLTQKILRFRKPLSYSIFKRKILLNLGELIAGIVFVLFGITISVLAIIDKLFSHPAYQAKINTFMAMFLFKISDITKNIPSIIWAISVLLLLIIIIIIALSQLKKRG